MLIYFHLLLTNVRKYKWLVQDLRPLFATYCRKHFLKISVNEDRLSDNCRNWLVLPKNCLSETFLCSYKKVVYEHHSKRIWTLPLIITCGYQYFSTKVSSHKLRALLFFETNINMKLYLHTMKTHFKLRFIEGLPNSKLSYCILEKV